MIFATAKEICEDDERRAHHGEYWTNAHLTIAKSAVASGKPALSIAKALGRQLSGLCIKLEKEGVLRKEYNHAECGSDYLYANVPTWAIPVPSTFADYCSNTTNPCAEIPTLKEPMSNNIFTTQTIVFTTTIETASPEQLIQLLSNIAQKQEELAGLRASDNAYIIKQLGKLSLAKAAVLAELEKRA
jgi:hypothetical protein